MTKEEKRKEYEKEYYKKNKEKIKDYSKEYQQKNKEKVKQYIKKNIEKVTQYHKEYQQKKRDLLHYTYVIEVLKKKGLTKEEIEANPEIVETKRLTIELKRELEILKNN